MNKGALKQSFFGEKKNGKGILYNEVALQMSRGIREHSVFKEPKV